MSAAQAQPLQLHSLCTSSPCGASTWRVGMAAAAAGCGPKGLTAAAAADRAAVCYCCCCCWWMLLLLLLLGSPCHGGSCGMLSSSVLAVLGVSSCIPAGTGQGNVEGDIAHDRQPMKMSVWGKSSKWLHVMLSHVESGAVGCGGVGPVARGATTMCRRMQAGNKQSGALDNKAPIWKAVGCDEQLLGGVHVMLCQTGQDAVVSWTGALGLGSPACGALAE
jgi:hypothetical protein